MRVPEPAVNERLVQWTLGVLTGRLRAAQLTPREIMVHVYQRKCELDTMTEAQLAKRMITELADDEFTPGIH